MVRNLGPGEKDFLMRLRSRDMKRRQKLQSRISQDKSELTLLNKEIARIDKLL